MPKRKQAPSGSPRAASRQRAATTSSSSSSSAAASLVARADSTSSSDSDARPLLVRASTSFDGEKLTKAQLKKLHKRLLFAEDTPAVLKHVLLGSWVSIKVQHVMGVPNSHGGISKKEVVGGSVVPLEVILLCDSGRQAVSDAYATTNKNTKSSGAAAGQPPPLEVHASGSQITAEGMATVRIKVNTLSRHHKGRKFQLRVRASDPKQHAEIADAKSNFFTVVSQRLHVVPRSRAVFFKDQGGKDKCLEFDVSLHDKDGLCTSRAIPIKTTLHYAVPEDGYPAAKDRTNNGKMKLLTLHEDMEHVLKGGKGLIRCRINDVSKNHMGNGFVIKASADQKARFPDIDDVAPGMSPVITVKSKRPKKQAGKSEFKFASSGGGGDGGDGDGGDGDGGDGGRDAVRRSGELGGPVLPKLNVALQASLQDGTSVQSDEAYRVLAEWGNGLSVSLHQVQLHLAHLTRFTQTVTQPLIYQLVEQTIPEGQVGDDGSIDGGGLGNVFGRGGVPPAPPHSISIGRGQGFWPDSGFSSMPCDTSLPSVALLAWAGSGAAPSSVGRQQSFSYSHLPIPNMGPRQCSAVPVLEHTRQSSASDLFWSASAAAGAKMAPRSDKHFL